ncbi:hypothetical protein D3273_26600 [Lichenibacterium minor]|uniref:Uncharacterized protein n=1 Tax=Lichenibacterium minor TaxID=2316528 RepID=A0A4Q2TXX6_9HYPH|nr:hypothetical protein [Lichenibacterium minor]RYC28933.1 hypothetical protein D3273_26600 [Lichenibacterium minor]
MRLRLTLAAVALVVAGGPGWAASPEGVFRHGGAYPLSATVFALDSAEGYAGRFTTGFPGDPNHCGGSFSATGRKQTENRIIFIGAPENGNSCHVTMIYNAQFNRAQIDEEGCGDFHGASCEFSGAVQRTER